MKVKFSSIANAKMKALVDGFLTEVEWHGLVNRTEDGFEVADVVVFPHKATSCHVVSDQAEYEKWLDSLTDAEFSALRLHGHSHVNMPVTPSGFDMKYRQDMVNNMPKTSGEDVFYIFVILNKRGECNVQVFDITNDKTYTKDEISVEFEPAAEIPDSFMEHACTIVTIPEVTTYIATTPVEENDKSWDDLIKEAVMDILYAGDEDAEDAYMYLRDLGGAIEECGGYYEPFEKL